MSISPVLSLDVNETFFSALQDVLRDQYGDEIISSQIDDVIDNQTTIDSISTSTGTVYKWIFATICSALIGLAGLLPVFFTPEQVIHAGASTNKADKPNAICQIRVQGCRIVLGAWRKNRKNCVKSCENHVKLRKNHIKSRKIV